jgi:uncharacterized phage infection (PIP) family protein YhgE
MSDLLKAVEFLGIPTTVAITLVVLLLITQIIGELAELMGKTVPEILKIRKYFTRKRQEKEQTTKMLKECQELLSEFNSHYNNDNITKRNNWMNNVNHSVQNNDQFIQALDAKMDKLLVSNEDLKTQLDQVKSNVLENEADRLRSELFDCGNRCRRNIRLHPEEMDHIREVYKKYSKVLHQNGTGQAEFEFITDYYNHQSFPAYHQRNN